MDNRDHIKETDLYAFRNNTMSVKDRMAFLEHISSCTYCSDKFAAFMSEDLITAPRDMKSNILKAVRQEQLIKDKVREASKKIQLLMYSLKVGAATSLAILILLLTVNISDMAVTENKFHEIDTMSEKANKPITLIIRDGMDAICNNIINLSNKIIK